MAERVARTPRSRRPAPLDRKSRRVLFRSEDLGFLGNLGADPGSMIPMALLAAGGYLALTRRPAEQVQAEQVQAEDVPVSPAPAPARTRWPNGWRERLGPAALHR